MVIGTQYQQSESLSGLVMCRAQRDRVVFAAASVWEDMKARRWGGGIGGTRVGLSVQCHGIVEGHCGGDGLRWVVVDV